MTSTKRPLKVFLCHAHSDKDTVKALYDRLTNDGVDAWLDKEKLLPGQDWELEIRKAVREADVVVVCLSKQFNQAGFRQKEVRLALDTAMEKPEGEIFIIPARLEECDTLESLRKWHWVDLFEENGYEMLMRALRARANSIDATLQAKKIDETKATSSHTKDNKTPKGSPIGTPISVLSPTAPIESQQTGSSSQDFSSIRINSNSVIQAGVAGNEVKESPKKLPSKKRDIPTSDKKEQNDKLAGEPKKRFKLKTEYVVAIIGAIATIVAGLLGSPLIERWFSPSPVVTETLTATSLPLKTPTSTEFPYPLEISDPRDVTMRLVGASDFLMGDNMYPDEKPFHKVYLKSFYIDKYEVSNLVYKACVDAGECNPPKVLDFYSNAKYETHPVVYVDWDMANAYCEWRGSGTRLPTEEEWEKAARGTTGWTYPWGFKLEGIKANYDNNLGTVTVDVFPNGQSPYQVFNMAGNVREWVFDWYDVYPDGDPTASKDFGQKFRVLRGGAWDLDVEFLRVANRDYSSPKFSDNDIGFRCAKDATP